MCNPASFVLTKTNVFWSTKTQSHSTIIEEFQLHENGVHGINIVKVEITPENNNYSLPIESWNYKVDQDILPDWYDESECETRARAALVDWAKNYIVSTGTHSVGKGEILIATGDTVVNKSGGYCWAYGNSVVNQSGGHCSAYGNSVVNQSGGHGSAYGNSVVNQSGGHCSAYGNSVVNKISK